jgi:hypothetical protein
MRYARGGGFCEVFQVIVLHSEVWEPLIISKYLRQLAALPDVTDPFRFHKIYTSFLQSFPKSPNAALRKDAFPLFLFSHIQSLLPKGLASPGLWEGAGG